MRTRKQAGRQVRAPRESRPNAATGRTAGHESRAGRLELPFDIQLTLKKEHTGETFFCKEVLPAIPLFKSTFVSVAEGLLDGPGHRRLCGHNDDRRFLGNLEGIHLRPNPETKGILVAQAGL
jgi:hypothetical protein